MSSIFPFLPNSQIAAYLRDSGGEDQDLSIQQQAAVIQAWCLQNNLILIQTFIDEARPGSTVVGRQGFQAMMHYFREKDCPATGLILWRYSRFSRDIDDSQFYKADLRRRGVIIHSMNDSIPEGINGRFFEAALDWMNAKFLEDLSGDVKRGLSHIMAQHGALGGTPPRGFIRQPVELGKRRDGRPHIVHRWAPDPETWELCRLAWQMRAEGASLKTIHAATRLYGSINSYATFFRNRLYLGEMQFGDQVITDYCDPLIDQATWDAVQRRNNHHTRLNDPRNSTHPRRVTSNYLLSGLVYCARCRAAMNGYTMRIRGKIWHYYECGAVQRRTGDCDSLRIPRETLETAVINSLRDYILQPESLLAIRSVTNENPEQQVTLDAVVTALAQTRAQIKNLTDIIAAEGLNSRHLVDRLRELEQTETAQLTQIAELNTRLQMHPLSAAEIETYAENTRRIIETATPDRLRQILHNIIHEITVERDDRNLYGLIEYYIPLKQIDGSGEKPSNTECITVCPHRNIRHTFYFTAQLPRRGRKRKYSKT